MGWETDGVIRDNTVTHNQGDMSPWGDRPSVEVIRNFQERGKVK